MASANFITFRDKRILHIDLSHLDAASLHRAMAEARAIIARQPPASLLTVTDVTEMAYDPVITKAFNEYTLANKSYVRAAAVLGCVGVRRIMLSAVAAFSRRKLKACDDIEQAKEWLATQDDEIAAQQAKSTAG